MEEIIIHEHPASLSPNWLTQYLKKSGYLPEGEVFSFKAIEKLKEDRSIYRLALEYSKEALPPLPNTLIYKFNDNGNKQVADTRFCAAIREVVFYEQIAKSRQNLPVARSYATGIDLKSGRSFLLLEDLAQTHYLAPKSGNSPYGGWASFNALSQRDFADLAGALAQIHAYWWDHERIHTEDMTQSTGDMLSMVDTARPTWVARQREAVAKLNGEFSDAELTFCQECLANWPDLYQRRIEKAANLTLMHVDCHMRNVMLAHTPEDSPIFFDWEGVVRGVGVSDLAHLLLSSMLPPKRRLELERSTLETYYRVLKAGGVDDYLLEDCQRDYRFSLVALVMQNLGGGPFLRSILSSCRDWGWLDLLDHPEEISISPNL